MLRKCLYGVRELTASMAMCRPPCKSRENKVQKHSPRGNSFPVSFAIAGVVVAEMEGVMVMFSMIVSDCDSMAVGRFQ